MASPVENNVATKPETGYTIVFKHQKLRSRSLVTDKTVHCKTVEEIGPLIEEVFKSWIDPSSPPVEKAVNITIGPNMYYDYDNYVVDWAELLDHLLTQKETLESGRTMSIAHEVPRSLMITHNMGWIIADISQSSKKVAVPTERAQSDLIDDPYDW